MSMSPEETIKRIAELSAIFASHANVGATETAGHFISILAVNPEKIAPFLAGNLSLVDDTEMFRYERGCLSWHGADGKVRHPAELRAIHGKPDH
jgi:hypothetical protein